MRAAALAFAIVFALTAAIGGAVASEEIAHKRTSVQAAGRTFASVCADLYPDLRKAQAAVQEKGFEYDKATGLFINAAEGQSFRIDSNRCGFSFFATKVTPSKIMLRFADAVEKRSKRPLPKGTNINLGYEDAGNGLLRVAAKLNY